MEENGNFGQNGQLLLVYVCMCAICVCIFQCIELHISWFTNFRCHSQKCPVSILSSILTFKKGKITFCYRNYKLYNISVKCMKIYARSHSNFDMNWNSSFGIQSIFSFFLRPSICTRCVSIDTIYDIEIILRDITKKDHFFFFFFFLLSIVCNLLTAVQLLHTVM